MRIAVMGAGGVGGYFGGLLARAGNQVTLIARGAHLEALKARDLTVVGHRERFSAEVKATDDPREVGAVELVIFTVKTYQNAAAIPLLSPLVGERTTVLTLQNGVESYLELSKALGEGHVLPGAAYIESEIEAPGVVRQQGEVVRIVFGELSGEKSTRAQRILDAFLQAKIAAELSTDILKTLWSKFLFITSVAGLTTTARAPMSQLLPLPEAGELLVAAMREAEAVGRAKGVNLDPDVVESTVRYIEGTVQDLKASMYKDLELGRPLELEALNGAVARMGREVGVPTPINSFIYSILKVHKEGTNKQ